MTFKIAVRLLDSTEFVRLIITRKGLMKSPAALWRFTVHQY